MVESNPLSESISPKEAGLLQESLFWTEGRSIEKGSIDLHALLEILGGIEHWIPLSAYCYLEPWSSLRLWLQCSLNLCDMARWALRTTWAGGFPLRRESLALGLAASIAASALRV